MIRLDMLVTQQVEGEEVSPLQTYGRLKHSHSAVSPTSRGQTIPSLNTQTLQILSITV